MKRNRILMGTACMVLMPACGSMCGQRADEPPVVEAQGSGEEEGSAEEVAEVQIEFSPLGQDINNFAGQLFSEAAPRQGNFVVSPVSIATSLHMLLPGAAGSTQAGINRAVWARREEADLLDASAELAREITASESVQITIANRIWVDQGWEDAVVPEFRETISSHFGAAFSLLDFSNNPEPSRLAVNEWVSEQTAERIPELLQERTITEITRMVLTNAVYFNAEWENPFDAGGTNPGTFTTPNGPVEAEYMHLTGEIPYVATELYEAVQLPYVGGEFEMIVLAPRTGPNGRAVDAGPLGALVSVAEGTRVANLEVYLPRFTFRWAESLKEPLSALGMELAFSAGSADFSRMVAAEEGEDVHLSDVVHESFVAVDEKGTEAAAATAAVIVARGMAAPPAAIVFRPERRFYFAIRHVETDAFLFVGRVDDPTAE